MEKSKFVSKKADGSIAYILETIVRCMPSPWFRIGGPV